MDAQIESARAEISHLKSQKRELESELTTLRAAPTVASLRDTVAKLMEEVTVLEHQLSPLRDSGFVPISIEEKDGIDKDLAKYERMLGGRKKMFKDIWGTLCEMSENLNQKELMVRMLEETSLSVNYSGYWCVHSN